METFHAKVEHAGDYGWRSQREIECPVAACGGAFPQAMDLQSVPRALVVAGGQVTTFWPYVPAGG